MNSEDLRFNGPPRGPRVVLAHGAGASMDSPFMETIAHGLAGAGLRVVRFEFPYMQARRNDGRRRPPNTAKRLEQTWYEVIELLGKPEQLFIGGKSMGGRIASRVADEAAVRGLVCLGYPFHPPGRPEKLRTVHLEKLRTPALILQGSRDPFGTREEIPKYTLARTIRIAYLEDGDHSFKPRVRSGFSLEDHLAQAVSEIVKFVKRRMPS